MGIICQSNISCVSRSLRIYKRKHTEQWNTYLYGLLLVHLVDQHGKTTHGARYQSCALSGQNCTQKVRDESRPRFRDVPLGDADNSHGHGRPHLTGGVSEPLRQLLPDGLLLLVSNDRLLYFILLRQQLVIFYLTGASRQ